MSDFKFDEITVGGHYFPRFVARPSALTELVLPPGWGANDTDELCAALEQVATRQGGSVSFARSLEVRPLSWWDRIRGVTAVRAVSSELGGDMQAARDLCGRCGVDPKQPLARLPWTDRKLLDLELAVQKRGHIVVVDDGGLDPLGQRRFAEHISKVLKREHIAIVAIRHPVSFTAGAWGPLQVRAIR